MDITDKSGVLDSLLPPPRQWRGRSTRNHPKSHTEAQQMDLAIANLLARGAVKEVQPQEEQFT